MKKTIVALVCVCFTSPIFAETIILKSGKTIEGKIIERTDSYLKVDFYGVPLTYYLDEIKTIEGEGTLIPSKAIPKTSESSTIYDDSIKQEKNDRAIWEQWYTNAQAYIQKVQRIIKDAVAETTPILAQIQAAKTRGEKKNLIQLMNNKLSPDLQAFENLYPPEGLEKWHQLQIQGIKQSNLIADAVARDDINSAQYYLNQMTVLDNESRSELQRALSNHNAPQKVINELVGNK